MSIMTVELRGGNYVQSAVLVGDWRRGTRTTMDLRGLRDLSNDAAAAAIRQFQANPAAVIRNTPMPGQSASGYVEGSGMPGTFIDTYGIPIAAGVGGLVIGLVIAKFARRRKG